MSFDALKKIVGQSAVVVVDLYLDENDPAIDSWLELTSYNTPKTTDLAGAYNPATPKKLYRFSNQQLGPAAGVHFPILRSHNSTPPVIKDGIGLFSGLTFTIADIITNDVYELPPNFSDRRVTGSFLAKLYARNYLHNRKVIYRQGFDPLNFDLNNFQSQTFIIDKVQGPSFNGIGTFSCLDPLVWTDESKAKAPRKSNGELTAAITAGDLSLNLTGTINPSEYGTTGYIFIDSEVLGYTVTADTPPTVAMTVTRAEWGTEAAEHDIQALAQDCFFANDKNVTDIILDLFNLTSITPDLINLAQFTDAKNTTLNLHNYTGIVTKPTGVGKLITNLLTLAQSQIFFDTVEGNISFIHIDEFASPSFIIDALLNIKPGTLVTKFSEGEQITRQVINWSRLDASNTDDDNFSKGYHFIDGLKEAPAVYGEANEGKEINTIWLDSSPAAVSLATGIAQKIVNKKSNMPVKVTFDVDVEYISSIGDGFWLADFIQIVNAPLLTGPNLEPAALNMQVTSIKPKTGNLWGITGLILNQTQQADIDYIIDLDQENLTLTDIAPAIPGKVTIVFIVSGVTIGSTSTANAALITGLYPDGLLIRNRGRIYGMGGGGGDGVGFSAPIPGSPGGVALEVQAITTIDNGNGGLIYGGGGGGSGSVIYSNSQIQIDGSGGGGGASYAPSAGGLEFNDFGNIPGQPGEDGNIDGPGQGGAPYIGGPNVGGNGGDWGLQGGSFDSAPGGAPGMSIIETGAGDYTITNGNNEFQLKPIPPLI